MFRHVFTPLKTAGLTALATLALAATPALAAHGGHGGFHVDQTRKVRVRPGAWATADFRAASVSSRSTAASNVSLPVPHHRSK